MPNRTIADLVGTFKDFFKINSVRLKDESGILGVKNSGDTAYAKVAVDEVQFKGSTSGETTVRAAAAAADDYVLPDFDGNKYDLLFTDGAGQLGWGPTEVEGVSLQDYDYFPFKRSTTNFKWATTLQLYTYTLLAMQKVGIMQGAIYNASSGTWNPTEARFYRIDCSAQTGDVTVQLPTPSSANVRIALFIKTPSASYDLIVKADTATLVTFRKQYSYAEFTCPSGVASGWIMTKYINPELTDGSDTTLHTHNSTYSALGHTHTESEITDLDHTDTDAIHDNVSSEISALTEKTTLVDADIALIEDSEASNAKKKALLSDIWDYIVQKDIDLPFTDRQKTLFFSIPSDYRIFGFTSHPGESALPQQRILAAKYGDSNLLLNSNFETGDFTNWTESDNGSYINISGDSRDGSYSASLLYTTPPAQCNLYQALTYSQNTGVVIKIVYKAASGGGLKLSKTGPTGYTDVALDDTGGEWRDVWVDIEGPVAGIYLTGSHSTVPVYVDSISVYSIASNTLQISSATEFRYGYDLIQTAPLIDTATVLSIGHHYLLDCSYLTSNRWLSLPYPGAAGMRIKLTVETGSNSYSFFVRGDTGTKINNGTSNTQWSRIYVQNETVEFVSTASNNWQVALDGRIANLASCKRAASLSIPASTWTLVQIGTNFVNVGGMNDLTNNRINIRRDGNYLVSGKLTMNASPDLVRVVIGFYVNGSMVRSGVNLSSASGSPNFSSVHAITGMTLVAGDYVQLYAYQNDSSSRNTENTAGWEPEITVIELINNASV